jgi:hypothetical protein
MSGPLKPGTPASRSGQYELVGPRGGRTGQERTVEPLPPTPKPGMGYRSSILQRTVPSENKGGATPEARRSS